MERKFLALGAFLALIGVVSGAFGAHLLKKYLEADLLAVFETAVRYQMYHAFAILISAVVMKLYPGKWVVRAIWLFLAGIIVFSGSLYTLSLTGIRGLGGVTPFGGLAFLGGWFCLIVHAYDKKRQG
jgi:uncharacterized membrane protein YgdD (TMEM256/DUF423 family)